MDVRPTAEAQDYTDQLNTEVQDATNALQRLEWMMTTAVIDPSLLASFREAINRVRNTGWIVQKSLSTDAGVTATEMLAQERIRSITAMSDQLFEDLYQIDGESLEGFETLLESIEKLGTAVRLRLERSETV